MRILTEGRRPFPADGWWAGRQLRCPNCDGTCELEATDPVRVQHLADFFGRVVSLTADIPCPTCSFRLSVPPPPLAAAHGDG